MLKGENLPVYAPASGHAIDPRHRGLCNRWELVYLYPYRIRVRMHDLVREAKRARKSLGLTYRSAMRLKACERCDIMSVCQMGDRRMEFLTAAFGYVV
jgi:hypothetical protein